MMMQMRVRGCIRRYALTREIVLLVSCADSLLTNVGVRKEDKMRYIHFEELSTVELGKRYDTICEELLATLPFQKHQLLCDVLEIEHELTLREIDNVS